MYTTKYSKGYGKKAVKKYAEGGKVSDDYESSRIPTTNGVMMKRKGFTGSDMMRAEINDKSRGRERGKKLFDTATAAGDADYMDDNSKRETR